MRVVPVDAHAREIPSAMPTQMGSHFLMISDAQVHQHMAFCYKNGFHVIMTLIHHVRIYGGNVF
jgi:hypothetical protein